MSKQKNVVNVWAQETLDARTESNFPGEDSLSRNNLDQVAEVFYREHENDKVILAEFKNNEAHKRNLKYPILAIITAFSARQLLVMNVIIITVILSTVIGDNRFLFISKIDNSVLPHILSFLKFYISATIVELLGMLTIIVTKIFENPIKDFFRINHQGKTRHH